MTEQRGKCHEIDASLCRARGKGMSQIIETKWVNLGTGDRAAVCVIELHDGLRRVFSSSRGWEHKLAPIGGAEHRPLSAKEAAFDGRLSSYHKG